MEDLPFEKGIADMFRAMRRFKQQISEEECIRILKEQPRGVLSMLGDDGYPYGIPMNHLYMEDGHLYFHGAKEGHKIDAIAKCDKVSFCVYDQGYRKDGEWALNINSVVVSDVILKENRLYCFHVPEAGEIETEQLNGKEHVVSGYNASGRTIIEAELIPVYYKE